MVSKMALTKKERLALLTAISFMHNYGEHFVPLIKGGSKEENERAWIEAKVIYKKLHKMIREKMKEENRAPDSSPPQALSRPEPASFASGRGLNPGSDTFHQPEINGLSGGS